MSEQWGAGPQSQDPQQPGGGWPQQQSGGWPQPQPPQQQPEGAQFGENPFPQQPGPFPGSGDYQQQQLPQPDAFGQSGGYPQQPQQPFGGSGDYPAAGIPYPGGPGYPPGFPGGPPPKQTNGFALAGAILCIVPLLGLIFSIIGLVRAKALGGAGRTAATVGIVLSVLIGGGATFGIYKLANSTAADPACISAENQVNAMDSKLTSDENQMKTDENTAAEADDFSNAANDLQTVKTSIDGDIGEATHADVKAALQNFDNDLGEMITDFKEIADGNSAGLTDLESRMNQITTDGDKVDSLCGNAVNG